MISFISHNEIDTKDFACTLASKLEIEFARGPSTMKLPAKPINSPTIVAANKNVVILIPNPKNIIAANKLTNENIVVIKADLATAFFIMSSLTCSQSPLNGNLLSLPISAR